MTMKKFYLSTLVLFFCFVCIGMSGCGDTVVNVAGPEQVVGDNNDTSKDNDNSTTTTTTTTTTDNSDNSTSNPAE